MARVVVTVPGERVVEEFTAFVSQPTTPSVLTPPPHIGVVEISQSQPTELIPGPMGPAGVRGSRWYTGDGDPTVTGALLGDMYVDDVSGDVWVWDGDSWEPTGTNIQGSPDTGTQILAKLAPVDGAGSGLDADTLDGQDGAYYLDYDNLTDKPASFPPTLPIPQSGVTNLVSDLALKAPLASPTFTGDPKAPTPATADNDTSIATTAYVKANITGVSQFPEAPVDGLTYGRKNAAWATIVGGAVVSDSAPGAPLQNGQLWYETDTGNTYVWVTDADSSQWVQQNVMPSGGAGDNISTAADMSIGFRTSGNRFVVNDKSDMSGSDVMTVSETGATFINTSLNVAGPISALNNFTSTSVACNINTTGAGTITLRPNGQGVPTGQATLDQNGHLTTSGSMFSAYAFQAQGTTVVLSTNAAGNIYLRPNGNASTTGQTTIDSTGNLTAAATISSGGNFTTAGNAVVLSATGAGTVYLRPTGMGSATGETTIGSSGIMTTANYIAVGQISSPTGANLGTTLVQGYLDTSKNINTVAAHHRFYNPSSAGSPVGQITTTNAATAYATSSSADLKDVHGDYDPQEAIAIIRADPVKSFTWKVGDGGDAVGWTAQHSHGVKPDLAVHQPAKAGTKDDEPDEPEWWGIDYGQRTPYLWAALTNALDRIDQLEARLAVLEGGA